MQVLLAQSGFYSRLKSSCANKTCKNTGASGFWARRCRRRRGSAAFRAGSGAGTYPGRCARARARAAASGAPAVAPSTPGPAAITAASAKALTSRGPTRTTYRNGPASAPSGNISATIAIRFAGSRRVRPSTAGHAAAAPPPRTPAAPVAVRTARGTGPTAAAAT